MTKEAILAKAKEYNSPCEFTDEEIGTIIKNDCACSRCGESIFELADFPSVIEGGTYCQDCEMELFYDTCPICEESFEKPERPEQHRLIVPKDVAEELEMTPGIYQVREFPFYLAAQAFGFERFLDDNIELVRELDIDSILRKCGHRSPDINCACICPECFDKYTMRKRVAVRYMNARAGLHRNINERGAIAAGR